MIKDTKIKDVKITGLDLCSKLLVCYFGMVELTFNDEGKFSLSIVDALANDKGLNPRLVVSPSAPILGVRVNFYYNQNKMVAWDTEPSGNQKIEIRSVGNEGTLVLNLFPK